MAGAVIALVATSAIVGGVADGGQGALTPPGGPAMVLADRFTVFFRLLLLMLLVLIIWLWMVGAADRERSPAATGPSGSPEFFVLLLTSALGMLFMVSTLNLLVMVVAIETASLPSYAVVASDKRSRLGAEAALKYVMFGAASAAIMVYGVSLLYGRFGTFDVSTIATRIAAAPTPEPVLWLGLAAIGAGVAFKIAAVPMHLWCPDVFQGAPVEITTWLSVASKAAGLGLLLRLVDAFSTSTALAGAMAPLAWGIGTLSAITCTVGNLAALRQENVKRILAYSSIAHAGYMMMAAAILVARPGGGAAGTPVNVGVAAVIAYLFVYVTMNVGAFGATALVVWQTGSDHLSSFTGLWRRAPWLALPMAVCLFSLIGLPPLGGFAAKWFLLMALGKTAAAQPWLWSLVIIAVINTAISLYYYVRIMRQMFLTDDETQPVLRPPLGGLALVNACAVVLLLLGTAWFSPLGRHAEGLASCLFRPGPAHGQATAMVGRGLPPG
jgi:NADH-quinone oxidoreductase subunit N